MKYRSCMGALRFCLSDSEPRLIKKTIQVWGIHYKDKAMVKPFHSYNGNLYTGKMTYLYCYGPRFRYVYIDTYMVLNFIKCFSSNSISDKSLSCHEAAVMRTWPFVRGIPRSPVNSPHKGQWRGALMFSVICAWTNGWVNNQDADDLRRHRVHYDVTVM